MAETEPLPPAGSSKRSKSTLPGEAGTPFQLGASVAATSAYPFRTYLHVFPTDLPDMAWVDLPETGTPDPATGLA
ncbi:MAG: hypothetical protein M3Q31_02745 [Actinomycetota bacterium]|nr:hypothetical protein [Actinomycetota bacterium]